MMRRYTVGSLETADMGLKSSQSLKNSEPTSSEMENSQCSSFDLFSQMMSQQQGYSSQPSEASQVAQRYYTKFASKPSLFRNTGGKEAMAISDKSGLTRRKSFQDVQEYQKQKVKEKEERDLICTLISLLKESTDEVKHVVEKLQSDLQSQIANACVKTEKALSKTYQCFQEYSKETMQEVINKLNVYQKTGEVEKKLQEKEAILETLHSELERSRAIKYDEMKQMLQETSSEHHQANIEEVNKTLQDTCNSWKLDQQKTLDEFCNTAVAKMEEKLKDSLQKVVQESNNNLTNIGEANNNQVVQAAFSEAQNVSVSRNGQTPPYHSYGSNGRRETNPTSHSQYPPPTSLLIGRHNASSSFNDAHGAPSNHVQIRPNITSVAPNAHGRPCDTVNLATQEVYLNRPIRSTANINSHQNQNDTVNLTMQEVYLNRPNRSTANVNSHHNQNVLPEQRMEFSSPSLSQQSFIQPTLTTHFTRWGNKGPSPVAAVAPLIKETSPQVGSMGGLPSVVPSKQDRRRKRISYLPPQRRSARLKDRTLEAKQYATCYSQEHKNQVQKRDGYTNTHHMTAIKHKSQKRKSQIDFEIAQASQRRSHLEDLFCFSNDKEIIQIPSRSENMTGYVQLCESQVSHHEPVFSPPVITYSRVPKRNRDQIDSDFQTVPQFASDYESDSDNSSSEGTFLSAQHHGVSSQDLFIDAINDQQMISADEEEEEVCLSFLRKEDTKRSKSNNHCRDAGSVATEFNRAVKKKRTLWGTASPQKRDLISFLTSSIRWN